MIEHRELYGEDADGNRGVWQYSYELEEDDKDMIIEQMVARGYVSDNIEYNNIAVYDINPDWLDEAALLIEQAERE